MAIIVLISALRDYFTNKSFYTYIFDMITFKLNMIFTPTMMLSVNCLIYFW